MCVSVKSEGTCSLCLYVYVGVGATVVNCVCMFLGGGSDCCSLCVCLCGGWSDSCSLCVYVSVKSEGGLLFIVCMFQWQLEVTVVHYVCLFQW